MYEVTKGGEGSKRDPLYLRGDGTVRTIFNLLTNYSSKLISVLVNVKTTRRKRKGP